MNYNENWQEDRRRHRENRNNNQRWESGNDRSANRTSGNWNNEEFAVPRSGSKRDPQHHNDEERPNNVNERYKRNPNWDDNAPYSSRFEPRNDYDISFNSHERESFPNRNYSAQGMTDPQYGDPRFSDRQRLGSNGGSSDSYERGNYGDYPVYGSSGRRFSENDQASAGSHIQDWNTDYDPRNEISLGRRTHELSHRGKGPKGYKRSDPRIKEDVCDALYDHHFVDASELEVEVKDGIVILSGNVDNRYARREAETAVDYISGIVNVENRIHVKSQSFHSRDELKREEEHKSKTQSQAESK